MKPRLTPSEIILKELPPEGREFNYTNESGELCETLKELIGTNPFQIQFRITPMGNTFDLKGTLKTSMDLQCSLCANDFKHSVELNLHEYIVIERALGKGDQTSKSNHAHEWETGGADYIVLESDSFRAGEYVHEAVALSEPIRPLCAPESREGCAHSKERVERPWLSYDSDAGAGANIRANPFQVLEKMKLKS